MKFNSAIYRGQLMHCRHHPKRHQFRYNVFMMYFDLDEVEQVLSLSPLWTSSKFGLARLKRTDFIAPHNLSIKAAVAKRIFKETGNVFEGSVRMLANLRYFGFVMNPIVIYYCFDQEEQLQFVVAEVTNTPWRETHAYVLPCHPKEQHQRIRFDKALHVSPFNDMNLQYEWRSNIPAENLSVTLENWRGDSKEFAATLALQREEITATSLARIILVYPYMTVKVCLAIYWQALKLYLKGVKFVSHPVAHSMGKQQSASKSR